MVVRRYQQRKLSEALVRQLLPDHEALRWEEWLLKVDEVLADRELLDLAQEALSSGGQAARGGGGLGRRWKWPCGCCCSST